MADAELSVDNREEQTPFMPHLVYTREELDQRHPRLEAPDGELLDGSQEAEADAHDSVLQHGLSLAKEIEEATTRFGRTRRTPTEIMSPRRLPNQAAEISISQPVPTPESEVPENEFSKGKRRKIERANEPTGRNGAADRPGQPSRRRSEKLRPSPAASTTCTTTLLTTRSGTSSDQLSFFNFLNFLNFRNSPSEDLGSRGNPRGDSCGVLGTTLQVVPSTPLGSPLASLERPTS